MNFFDHFLLFYIQ